MAITKSPKKEGVDEILKLLDKQTKKLRKRLNQPPAIDEVVKKKKEVTQQDIKYIPKLKIACIVGLIGLAVFVAMSLTVPSLYDAVIALFRDIWPSLDSSPGMDFYVD